jgi:carbamoyl-phosphate synthase large subunit
MEHIEEAGIHSGDSACSLPPYSLKASIVHEIERQAKELALALNVVGLMNVQFAVKDDVIYVLEVNPRASRTVPFVAKVIGLPVAKLAARVMAGESLASMNLTRKKLPHVAVKEAVFPFNRFPGVDVLLGPEMRSTGEVMGLDKTYDMAFAKSQLGAGMRMPLAGNVFISVKDADKPRLLPAVRQLVDLGFNIFATGGTQRFFEQHGLPSTKINKVLEGRPHVVDAIKNGQIHLVLNTTETKASQSDSKSLRQTALLQKVPITPPSPVSWR